MLNYLMCVEVKTESLPQRPEIWLLDLCFGYKFETKNATLIYNKLKNNQYSIFQKKKKNFPTYASTYAVAVYEKTSASAPWAND